MATMEAVDFSVDRYSIQPGECVTFRWHVEGVKEVYFYAQGERWQDHGVVGVSEQERCPTETTTYYLRIVKTDNSTIGREITIEVQGAQHPTIQRFTVTPSGQIMLGDSVKIQWQVSGPTESIKLRDGAKILHNTAPPSGEQENKPQYAGEHIYELEVQGPGGCITKAQHTTQVVEGSGRPDVIPL